MACRGPVSSSGRKLLSCLSSYHHTVLPPCVKLSRSNFLPRARLYHRNSVLPSCRTPVQCHRSIAIPRWLNGFNSVRYLSQDEDPSKDISPREEDLEHEARKEVVRKTPFVDLTKKCGISVKHTMKETKDSMLFRQCLAESPDINGFTKAIDSYISQNKLRNRHVDFICTAIKFVKPYRLHKDPEVYTRLMDIFPRNRFETRTHIDRVLPQLHPQLFLCIDMMVMMEDNEVALSPEYEQVLQEVFGKYGVHMEKLQRYKFWSAELSDQNPYKLDERVYLDRIDIIKAAITRINTRRNNDGTTIVEISPPIKPPTDGDGVLIDADKAMIDYNHFIISSQTSVQKQLLSHIDVNKTIYIEGPQHIWINHVMEYYFVMKTGQQELTSTEEITVDEDEEREGVVLGISFVTEPYSETLLRWLKHMQEDNPLLEDVNVVFNIEVDYVEEDQRVLTES